MLGIDPYAHPSTGVIPKWSIPGLLKLRNKLMKRLRPVYLGLPVLASSVFTQVHSILLESLPDDGYTGVDDDGEILGNVSDNIDEFLKEWYGESLDYELARKIVDIFSGNLDTFRYGYKYRKWDVVRESVWGLIRVSDIERLPEKGKKYFMEFTVIAGPATGVVYTSRRFSNVIQKRLREIGIPKWKHKYPDEMLYGMHYIAWMTHTNKQILNEHIHVTASAQKCNRNLMEARLGRCTGGYMPLGKPCIHACPFGTDACPIAWHKDTYKRKSAHVCRNLQLQAGFVSKHKGLMTKQGKGICMKCIYQGYTEEVIRGREQRLDQRDHPAGDQSSEG